MIPSIGNVTNLSYQEYRHPNETYRLGDTTVSGKLYSSIEAVQQAIYHIVNTERYSTPIYSDDYGIELEHLIGTGFDTVNAEIEDLLQDALLQDDRITGVSVTSCKQSDADANSVLVEFTVKTIYGDVKETLEVGD